MSDIQPLRPVSLCISASVSALSTYTVPSIAPAAHSLPSGLKAHERMHPELNCDLGSGCGSSTSVTHLSISCFEASQRRRVPSSPPLSTCAPLGDTAMPHTSPAEWPFTTRFVSPPASSYTALSLVPTRTLFFLSACRLQILAGLCFGATPELASVSSCGACSSSLRWCPADMSALFHHRTTPSSPPVTTVPSTQCTAVTLPPCALSTVCCSTPPSKTYSWPLLAPTTHLPSGVKHAV
mmetsp:Transcript_22078/g.75034  ORF Transcript_22078/g.75034 Transcript_22078/m.75034 type:complete len:238 (+) Transcript_22078:2707-3420(+)